MSTLLLSPRNIPDYEPISAAALADGWLVTRLSNWRIETAPDDRLAVYGEPLFVAAVAQQLGLVLLEPPFGWLSSLPQKYLRRQVNSATLASLPAISFPAFVKPADDKCFPARVYENSAEVPVGEFLTPATPIIASEPVHWEVEFRCFVRERMCVGLSIYARDGQLAQSEDGSWPARPEEVMAAGVFVARLIADQDIALLPALVIDIGRISGRGWAVVEANPAWGAGIYGCDPRGALRAIARGCRSAADLTNEDRRWIVKRGDQEPAT